MDSVPDETRTQTPPAPPLPPRRPPSILERATIEDARNEDGGIGSGGGVRGDGDGDGGSGGDGDGCSCEAVNPVSMESAWEKMMALRVECLGAGSNMNNSSSSRSRKEPLDLRIFAGTWNVAGRVLENADDIGEWLDVDLLDDEGEKRTPPDIFAVGFQEVVELKAHNVVLDSILDTQSKANSLKWFTLVYAFMLKYGERHGIKYTIVSEQRLLGTYILIMATETLSRRIRHVQSVAIPTGLGGVLGNKGAVAVRMEVAKSCSICFVCVHMAAHRENLAARNAEYATISSRLVFSDTTARLLDNGGKDARQANNGSWGGWFGAGGVQGSSPGGLSPSRTSELRKTIKAAVAFGLPKGGGSGKSPGPGSPSGSERLDGSQTGPGKGANDPGQRKKLSSPPVNTTADSNGKSNGNSGAAQEATDDFVFLHSEEGGISNDQPKTKTVLQADIVFWIGDLNYRIADEVPDSRVHEMIRNDELEALRNLDQLNLARSTGEAFEVFQEGPLCFPPSYKYIPGTRKLDDRPEKKLRCPSWCDRVLYSVGMYGGDSVRRLALDRYWSSGPLLSDHMTVNALFRTSLTCAPEEKFVESEIEAEPLNPRKAASATILESTPFPRVTLDPPALALTLDGTRPHAVAVEICNDGGVGGEYHVCKNSLPAWASLREGNARGKLGPGEKTELGIVVDVAAVVAAVGEESNGATGQVHRRPSACAVLRVEVDGGGSGALLPVVCTVADE